MLDSLEVPEERRGTLLGLSAVLLAVAAAVAGLFCCSACVRLGTAPAASEARAQDAECRYYDDSYLAWKAVAYVGDGLAAAGGTGGALAVGIGDDTTSEDWAIGLTVTGVAGAVLGGLGAFMATEYAERYTRSCQGSGP